MVCRHVVEVQLDGVRAGLGQEAGVSGPAAGGRGVEAGDHRNVDRLLGAADPGEVAVRHRGDVTDVREVVEGLGELPCTRFHRPVQLDLVVNDLLLEQGRKHDRGGARLDEPTARRRDPR